MSDSPFRDSFGTLSPITLDGKECFYFRLRILEEKGLCRIDTLPFTIRILIEQLLRAEDGHSVTAGHIEQLAGYDPTSAGRDEVLFLPSRILMQDFTGVPAVVDLAALRSALAARGKDPRRIDPRIPVDLVIDHSVQVDEYGSPRAFAANADLEFARNRERYEFLHWAQKAFRNFRVIPPASGICHQVNLEYLAQVVEERTVNGKRILFPDTLLGTDSHTTMINALGVLGWGVGGIEAEAAMLGHPLSLRAPPVIGFRLIGSMPPGATATDLVLTITRILRDRGVVETFIEFFGPGLAHLSVPDRATIANMCPEYGATCAFFPVDGKTIAYLRYTGRSNEALARIERYCREQCLFRDEGTPEPAYTDIVELDLASVAPTVAGPKRPHDTVRLSEMRASFRAALLKPADKGGFGIEPASVRTRVPLECPGGIRTELSHGSVVIAAITSCTNTSNPEVMLGAGILAKKAVEAGLSVKPYVKTSLAPGSPVVMRYLEATGLGRFLEALGFHLVGFGCTTCIGNSGPLPRPVQEAIESGSLVAASVLSGNRNFEGRINPHTRASYLASPPLVVAYALAGTLDIDLDSEPLGVGKDGSPVFLKDLWPDAEELETYRAQAENPAFYQSVYSSLLTGNATWNAIPSRDDPVYAWDEDSTYIQQPPFFTDMAEGVPSIGPIEGARVLVMLGDSVTTDHISPAGSISPESEAGRYLLGKGVAVEDFNTYGSRRGNYLVMTRGTFANVRLRNLLAPGTEGGMTTYVPTGEVMSIYAAATRYKAEGIPVIVLAGRDYGMGSSRDWAAKGTYLLGIKAVLAESFERIHRSNLVGMGVLPLEYAEGTTAQSIGLTGRERFFIPVGDEVRPKETLEVTALRDDGTRFTFAVTCRLDSPLEVEYYRNGGILQTVLRSILRG